MKPETRIPAGAIGETFDAGAVFARADAERMAELNERIRRGA